MTEAEADSDRVAVERGLLAPVSSFNGPHCEHSFQHIGRDGIRTSLEYRARRAKRLILLDAPGTGVISVACDAEGNVTRVIVDNVDAVRGWTSVGVDATILSGDKNLGCTDAQGKPVSVLHRLVAEVELDSETKLEYFDSVRHRVWTFNVVTTAANVLDAFDELKLEFYRGRGTVAAAKEALSRATAAASMQPPKNSSAEPFAVDHPREVTSSRADSEIIKHESATVDVDVDMYDTSTHKRATNAMPLATFENLLVSDDISSAHRSLLQTYDHSCTVKSCWDGKYRDRCATLACMCSSSGFLTTPAFQGNLM